MNKPVISIIIFFVLIMAVGCQRELILDNPVNEHLVVLNGVLVADSLPVSVSLSYTQPLEDSTSAEVIDGAEVKLYCNDSLLGYMDFSDSGTYTYNIAPLSGNTYKVEALVDGDTVWAETTVPAAVPVTECVLDSIKSGLGNFYYPRFYVTLNDRDETNYYWFWIYSMQSINGSLVLYPTSIYSGSPYFDDFMAAQDPGSSIEYNTDYGSFARMPDTGFNGTSYRFDMVPIGGNRYEYFVYLNSMDVCYDKYLKSYLEYTDYNSLMEDFAVYYQPSFVYSNVHNGTGIIGSISSYSKHFIVN